MFVQRMIEIVNPYRVEVIAFFLYDHVTPSSPNKFVEISKRH